MGGHEACFYDARRGHGLDRLPDSRPMGRQHPRRAGKRSIRAEQHILDRGADHCLDRGIDALDGSIGHRVEPNLADCGPKRLRTPLSHWRPLPRRLAQRRHGERCRSWHGGVAEWLYADDRIVHDTETGRELGTLKWVSVQVGYEVQRRGEYSLSPDETTAACDDVFTQWKRVTDMREPGWRRGRSRRAAQRSAGGSRTPSARHGHEALGDTSSGLTWLHPLQGSEPPSIPGRLNSHASASCAAALDGRAAAETARPVPGGRALRANMSSRNGSLRACCPPGTAPARPPA